MFTHFIYANIASVKRAVIYLQRVRYRLKINIEINISKVGKVSAREISEAHFVNGAHDYSLCPW